MFCFHGTSREFAVRIAAEGFDPCRRAISLRGIPPYIEGEYLTTDPCVALKYSRQKERNRNTFSVLVVELPAYNFKLRNGVWCQSKFDTTSADEGKAVEAGRAARTDTIDSAQSTTCVCEDSRMLVPRALLTFKPNVSGAGTTSAMACYDVSISTVKTAADTSARLKSGPLKG